MAYSRVTYTSNGVLTDYDITFSYLDASLIAVTIYDADGVSNPTSMGYTYLTPTRIRLNSAPADLKKIRIYKNNSVTVPYVDYTDGAELTAQNLDDNSIALLEVAQRAIDDSADALAALSTTQEAAAASAASAAESAASTAEAEAIKQEILLLQPADLPLEIVNGGTGQITKDAAFKALAPTLTGAPDIDKVIGTNDGVNFTLVPKPVAPVIPGTGGTTLTGSVTLTAASPASMVVTPATPGLYATLPNATTLTKGMSQFAIYNAGEYDYGVKDFTGAVLGWVRPQVGGVLGLADGAAAAGIWNLTNIEKLGLTALFNNPTVTVAEITPLRPITIDATRELFLFGSYSAIYGVVFDSASNSWGSAVLIRAVGVTLCNAIVSGVNQVLVTSCDGGGTSFQACTLTITGTAIAVNSTASAALADICNVFGNLVAVGTSFVQGYSRNTSTIGIRALSITGTTVTIGNEYVQTAAGGLAPLLLVTGSNLRVVSVSNSTLYCRPYTVAGVVLTTGTEASIAVSFVDSNTVRAFVNGNGNVVVETIAVNSHKVHIFKLTGTVEAISTVTLGSYVPLTIDKTGYTIISASKTLFVGAVGGTIYSSIVTDTAGTASVGTTLAITGVTNDTPVLCSTSVVGNLARVTSYVQTLVTSCILNCSGVTPTINRVNKAKTTVFAYYSGVPTASQDKYGVLNGKSICTPSADYSMNASTSIKITEKFISTNINVPSSVNAFVKGKSDSISWDIYTGIGTAGITIQRIEAAA